MAAKKKATKKSAPTEAQRRWDAEAARIDDYHQTNANLATTPEQRSAWLERWESAKRQLGQRP